MENSVLVQNGSFTPSLISVLQEIFSRYESKGASGLTQIEASRLWYQCGINISSLKAILGDTKSTRSKKTISIISFEVFHRLLQRIIADDEKHFPLELSNIADDPSYFEVRLVDKVLAIFLKQMLCADTIFRFSSPLDRRKSRACNRL